jgi:tetratricopeptide (TPR) repeat protein
MNLRMNLLMPLVFIFVILLSFSASADAANPREELQQMVEQLQQSPSDTVLREKIIQHVQGMKPAPAVPEEAKRYLSRGMAAMKSAASEVDFKDSVKEFEKAALAAPWLANAYYNLGISQDKAGVYAEAITNLKLYLMAEPDAGDAEAVKGLIYEIEYRQEKAEKESSPEAIAAKKQKEYEEWLRKLDGARFVVDYSNRDSSGKLTLDIRGNEVIAGVIRTWLNPEYWPNGGAVGVWMRSSLSAREVRGGERYTINGRQFIIPDASWCNNGSRCSETATISEDGSTITYTSTDALGGRNTQIYMKE